MSSTNSTTDFFKDIKRCVEFALYEDVGSGDITAQLIPLQTTLSAYITCRETAVICGRPWVDECFKQIDPNLTLQWFIEDGEQVQADTKLLAITGTARSILTAERCALNFLQTLSSTATHSHRLAALVAHTQVKLLDTRKTLPGLRLAQKYAVSKGGCFNHRIGLYDAFLIKENHINACGSIAAAINQARQLHPQKPVEIEVENLDQLNQALSNAADIIMLDNFSLDLLKQAVSITQRRSKLEASGGINADTLIPIAETGVDFISIGALTKDCKALDLSLLIAT